MFILAIEDHEDTRFVLERFLVRCGHQVATAGTVAKGLELLANNEFDAILSDIALPDGTGYALMNEARKRGVTVLAIALSAYSFPADVAEAKVTGFDYHLGKPYDCGELRTLLDAAALRQKSVSSQPTVTA